MLLKWLETDELGDTHVREGSPINTKNVHEYAKRNCRRCHGRGIELYNNGRNPYTGDLINPRYLSCDCVLANLRRIESAGN